MQNNVSFKGCIPIEFYAKHPITKKYVPIVKDENISKCQRWVNRNLNNTIHGHNRSDIFINAYDAMDSDYTKTSKVHSYFDKYTPRPETAKEPAPRCVWLFTGKDAEYIKKLEKNFKKEISDIFKKTGEEDNAAIRQARRRFRADMQNAINNFCSKIRNKDDVPYVMRILFTPQYNKKGDLQRFVYQDVFFDRDVRI